ncbi:AAA family ATPase [Methyloferula stellata]|uniref:AAA family ATPase n=1 Tax=Methyloferula stellata TaxID=876270 RepID=UPI00037CD3E6|nr:AAA family ATPase [Methyloferula stellata]
MKAAAFDVEQIAPVPRISVQAFCESPDVAQTINDAIADRRMEKAHVKVHMGGLAAAIEAYRTAPTPNVIVIETALGRDELIANLESLAEFCDAGTKVVVLGRMNDILLYRDLMARGVSEYLVAPFAVLDFIRTISGLYTHTGGDPLGKIIAVVGAKGGVGASTIAHNVAWSIARDLEIQTVIVDMDLGFGTAGLDFNQDPPQGIAEAVFAPDRVDANLVDRLLSKCSEKLSILAAPATLDRVYDFSDTAFDSLIDILRASTPFVVLDIPHMWTAWTKRLLIGADEIVIVGTPDLANLRNIKSILDTVRGSRLHDAKPRLILNLVGVPKRPEITMSDFAKAVDLDPVLAITFEPKLFGTAANNGQMIAEVDAASKTAEMFSELARIVAGRSEIRKAKRNILEPFMQKLGRKKAS